jgi:regulation of enolase protein 1 (concanavalin A-like superfamily)
MNRSTLFFSYILGLALPVIGQTPQLAWEHQPAKYSETVDSLSETVPAGTDYWRQPDFTRDNAPFQYREQSGNFEAKVRISGKYRERYHQAGLMIRIDEKNWIKAGIEFVNGKQNVSAVVTHDLSDWSVTPRPDNPEFIWLRLQRSNDEIHIEYSTDNAIWSLLRVARFPANVPVKIGMFAAAPGKLDLSVTFDHFTVGPITSISKEE